MEKSDDSLKSDIQEELDWDQMLDDSQVDVRVQDGHVTMRGDVRHHYERQAAELAVARVKGVRGISNRIAITSQPVPSDVADRIKRAFRRNAIIDDSRISVTTNGSTVYLDGEVGSWKAEEEAVDTAWGAPGVTDVVDRLIIVS